MSLQRYFFLIISFLLITISCTYSQSSSGLLKGVISDATTGDVLFGANIILKGTSLGAATDIKGSYRIPNIPAGNYTLVVRYIGYQTKEFPIKISGGETREFDASLQAEALEGETVVVTAQALGQKEAINQQLTSNTIINVVSAEKMRELPDDNASAALSRLPGVSLMDGDKVVIRGVQSKLNQVLINGIQLPSTDVNDRSTNLGFISSNMLSGIQVIKALTPDMDANAIGGVVNLKLKEAPSDFHMDVLTQGNYNSTDETWDNYKFWISASDRFFDNKLGVFLQGNADRSNVGNQQASNTYSLLGRGNTTYGEGTYQMTDAYFEDQEDIYMNNGGSLMLDYILPHGKIVLQNTYAHNSTDARHYLNRLDFGGDNIHYTINRDKYGKDLYVNALQAENYFGDIKVEASLSHSYTTKYTNIAYNSYANFDFGNESASKFPFGVDANGKKITYSDKMLTLDMNRTFQIYDNLPRANADSSVLTGWVTGRKEAFYQHLYNGAFDVTIPYAFSKDVNSTWKVGAKYVRTTRVNDVQSYYSGSGDEDTYVAVRNYFKNRVLSPNNRLRLSDVLKYNWKRGQNYLKDEYDFKNGFRWAINTDVMDDFLVTSMKGWSPAEKKSECWQNDFDGAEVFSAGYIMGTFDILSKLTVMAGLRFEHYNMKYDANFTYVTHSVYGDAVRDFADSLHRTDRNDDNLFPNVQVRYKVNDWVDVRFAYTTGIARPDYLSIMPKVYFIAKSSMEVGNTKLKPTYGKSFDLNASFYNNEIGLLTIGGFYKKLTDVFYTTTIYYANIKDFDVSIPDSATLVKGGYAPLTAANTINCSLNNKNPGYVRGLEIDWQTNFWYLPQPLNALVLDVNYTKSWSKMDYNQVLRKTETYKDPVTGKTKTRFFSIPSNRNARLVNQADDVVNVALGIDYKGFSGRISFNMQGNVINTVGLRPEEDAYTGNIYRWDFTLKQDLPLKGLSIALNGVNIFHNPIYSYRKFRKNVDLPITENLVTIFYSPTIFQCNLRYSF